MPGAVGWSPGSVTVEGPERELYGAPGTPGQRHWSCRQESVTGSCSGWGWRQSSQVGSGATGWSRIDDPSTWTGRASTRWSYLPERRTARVLPPAVQPGGRGAVRLMPSSLPSVAQGRPICPLVSPQRWIISSLENHSGAAPQGAGAFAGGTGKKGGSRLDHEVLPRELSCPARRRDPGCRTRPACVSRGPFLGCREACGWPVVPVVPG